MKFEPTALPDVVRILPTVFEDARGSFFESWHAQTFANAGIDATFVQQNFSESIQGTLRGIHYQIRQAQGRLVRVVSGEVFDVAVDLRRSSPSFGRWVGERLSARNRQQLWIPPGFGHGFLVLSEKAVFSYHCTDYYAPQHERSIIWNDPTLGIHWPLDDGVTPVLSEKDENAGSFEAAKFYD